MNFLDAPRLEQPPRPAVEVPRDLVLDFGKRKGLAVSWVAQNDLRYALWLMGQGFVQRNEPLWLCLRRHVVRALQYQEADHEARQFA